MAIDPDYFMAAYAGTFTINDTDEQVINADGIFVSKDAVFADLEINEAAADVRDVYISTEGGTVTAGTLITPGQGNIFTKIKLTSGEVTAILTKTTAS